MAKTADDVCAEALEKAATAHSDACRAARSKRDAEVERAARTLAEAQERHDAIVVAADQAHELTEQQAHAAKARATKAAMTEWTTAERQRLNAPETAFLRKAPDGRLLAHAIPGAPPVATAYLTDRVHWCVETDDGTTFVGGELAARRMLWQALTKAHREAETGALA